MLIPFIHFSILMLLIICRGILSVFTIGGQFGDNQLHISLEELLKAEEKGKWWLVGSAWDGKNVQRHNPGILNYMFIFI